MHAGGGAAVPARAAIAAAEAADFHWHLARADRERSLQGGGAPQHWRWRVSVIVNLLHGPLLPSSLLPGLNQG